MTAPSEEVPLAGVRSLVVPGSLAIETADPRVATYKAGLIGRACAIFGIGEVVVYEDADHPEGRKISRLLEYQSTAPYLRKRLFPISDELQDAGVLPPLNLPLHRAPRFAEAGQLRFGAMEGGKVDIGLAKPADLELHPDDERPDPGEQFPVRVLAARTDSVLVEPYHPGPDEMLTFDVVRAPNLRTALRGRQPILGTSKQGEPLAKKHLVEEDLALVFGTPEKGIEELLDESPSFPLVNTIPDQGTETVRVEEAIFATLGLIHGASRGLPV